MAYEALEPMGNIENTYMAAVVCATIVNSIRGIFSKKGERIKSISPLDFIPKLDIASDESEPVKEQTMEEQKSSLWALAKALGAKIKRRGAKK